MKPIEENNSAATTKVSCYACCRTVDADGREMEFGSLIASWGRSSTHEGESYDLSLCDECFFRVLGDLRLQRAIQMNIDSDENYLNAFDRATGTPGSE